MSIYTKEEEEEHNRLSHLLVDSDAQLKYEVEEFNRLARRQYRLVEIAYAHRQNFLKMASEFTDRLSDVAIKERDTCIKNERFNESDRVCQLLLEIDFFSSTLPDLEDLLIDHPEVSITEFRDLVKKKEYVAELKHSLCA